MDIKTNVPTTPFGKTDKAKHTQEVTARAAFQTLDDAVQDAPPGGQDSHTISRQVVEATAAGLLGVSQAQVETALSGTDATSFDANSFTQLVAGLAPANGAPEAPTGPVLEKGAKNDPEAVELLQMQLHARGLYQGAIDGVYGKGTEDAVKAFQQSVGHVDANGNADGKAGPITRAALKAQADAAAEFKKETDREEFLADHPQAQANADGQVLKQAAVDTTNAAPLPEPTPGDPDLNQANQDIQEQQVADTLDTIDTTGDKADALAAALKTMDPADGATQGVVKKLVEQLAQEYPMGDIRRMQDGSPADQARVDQVKAMWNLAQQMYRPDPKAAVSITGDPVSDQISQFLQWF